jgi:hypothetical protein
MPQPQPRPDPTPVAFETFGEGLATSNAPWRKNRVYFAAGPEQTRRWSRYISTSDRSRLSALNFSRFGVLAIFFAGRNGYEELSVKAMQSQADALFADVLALPFCWRCSGPAPNAARSGWGSYVLVTMKRGELQSPVPGRLYVRQLPRPDPTAPLSSEEVIIGGHNTTPVPVADWELRATYGTWHPDEQNRIFYASTPSQTNAWKYHVYDTRETRKALDQNFSRYGLLAIFLNRSAASSSIDGVYLRGSHTLNVVLRAPPPLPPLVSECQPLGDPCVAVSVGVPGPQYLLVAIRKDSLAGAVKRLYISELG